MAKVNPFARYTKAVDPANPRIIASSSGEVGSGKTDWWLRTAPGPIVVHSFDDGLKGVVEKFQDEKDIYYELHEWLPTPDTSKSEAEDMRDKFTESYEDSLKIARTVLIDRETDLWEVYRVAEFGPTANDTPKEYAPINKRYRKLVNGAKFANIHLGILRGMKDVWGSKVNQQGKMGLGSRESRIPAGMREIEALVNMNIFHFVVPGDQGEPAQFGIRVGKARGPGSENVQYQEFMGLSFAELGQVLFPDSSDEDWE